MLEVSRKIETEKIIDFDPRSRFIKLPIQNFLKILEIEPIRPQIALVNAINDPEIRFVVGALSRRTGKTFISNIISNLLSLAPNYNILIMAPNYGLSQISWDIQRQLFKRFEVELSKSNAKDKVIELPNGSTVRMGSVSQPDSVVGRSYDLILFDEAALDKRGEDVFNLQLRPTLDKENSKAIFISTPRGPNWFHDFYMRGYSDEFPEWASIRSDYKENPRVSLKDIEQAKKSMSSAKFRQEYMAEFVVMQGQIWEMPEDNFCLPEHDVVDTIAGLDIGFRDPTAYIVIETDGHNFYVVDEYLSAEKTTDKHGSVIADMIEKYDIDFTYIDSAAQQTRYDLVMNWDISTINAKKSILDGIGYVASIIDNGRLFVGEDCVHTKRMLANYVWDDRTGLQKEKPKHDEYSHMADALRYAVYSHAYNMELLSDRVV